MQREPTQSQPDDGRHRVEEASSYFTSTNEYDSCLPQKTSDISNGSLEITSVHSKEERGKRKRNLNYIILQSHCFQPSIFRVLDSLNPLHKCSLGPLLGWWLPSVSVAFRLGVWSKRQSWELSYWFRSGSLWDCLLPDCVRRSNSNV